VVLALPRAVPKGPVILIGTATLLLALDDAMPGYGIGDPDLLAFLLSCAIGAAAVSAVLGPARVKAELRRRWPAISLGLAVSVVATVVALGMAEAATRWLCRDITTTSDDRGYFSHRWERSSLSLNSHGFRDREFSEAKPPGSFRVAVLGDSFAYGNGIPAEARFSDLMRHALPPNVEVLNFGVPGHNTPELVTELRTTVSRFAPDFALVQWFVNDVEGSGRERPSYRPLLPSPAVHNWLHESSALYTLLDTWWIRRQVAGLSSGSYAGYMRARYEDPQSEAVRVDRSALRELLGEARRRHMQVGMVLFPDSAYDLGDGYPFEFLHARVRDFCGENGLTCLDLRRDFAAVRMRQSLWANRFDTHPSALANSIAATRIIQTFEPQWLASQPRTPQ
jgi:hypothetical protein